MDLSVAKVSAPNTNVWFGGGHHAIGKNFSKTSITLDKRTLEMISLGTFHTFSRAIYHKKMRSKGVNHLGQLPR